MIALIAVLFVAVFAVMAWLGLRQIEDLREERSVMWGYIETLEADKRALTESLCRAEGKPFLPVKRAERQPSEGWFDGAPRVKTS